MYSSESPEKRSPSESAEFDRLVEDQISQEQYSRKILPRITESKQPSFFARWFEMIPPDAPIREEEYYWPSGQALEADFFSDERYERYLNKPARRSSSVGSEEDFFLGLPPLDVLSESEESYSRQSSIESGWSVDDASVQGSGPPPLPLVRELSDWSQMPQLLPPLNKKEKSDWSQMPALLPPLPKAESGVDLKLPAFDQQQSDWSVMPAILPPLMDSKPSEPSDWVPMPENIVPASIQQESWDAIPPANDADDYSSQPFVVYSQPVFYPQYSYYGNPGYVDPGFVQPQANVQQSESTALVLYQPAYDATAHAIAKSLMSFYTQFSFYDLGEFNALICQEPCTMYITPSKTMTECFLNYVYPMFYIHKKTGLVTAAFGVSQVMMGLTMFHNQKPYFNDTNLNSINILRVD